MPPPLLPQIGGLDVIHIIKGLIFAAHSPNKGIITGAHTRVNTPGGTDNGIIIFHHYMPCFLGLTHHMEDDLIFRYLKIGIYLHTALMRVAGHGVPVAAGLHGGHTHGQLASFENTGVNKLVDNPLVAGFQCPQGALCGIRNGNELRLISAVCRRTDHIKTGRILEIDAKATTENLLEVGEDGYEYFEWTTSGHTDTNVCFYAYGSKVNFMKYSSLNTAKRIKNTDINKIMKDFIIKA